MLCFTEWYIKNFSSLGSAENGSDYTTVFSPMNIPASNSTDDVIRCIVVNVTDNLVFEDSETFTVTVTTNNTRVAIIRNTTVTIIDNEG